MYELKDYIAHSEPIHNRFNSKHRRCPLSFFSEQVGLEPTATTHSQKLSLSDLVLYLLLLSRIARISPGAV